VSLQRGLHEMLPSVLEPPIGGPVKHKIISSGPTTPWPAKHKSNFLFNFNFDFCFAGQRVVDPENGFLLTSALLHTLARDVPKQHTSSRLNFQLALQTGCCSTLQRARTTQGAVVLVVLVQGKHHDPTPGNHNASTWQCVNLQFGRGLRSHKSLTVARVLVCAEIRSKASPSSPTPTGCHQVFQAETAARHAADGTSYCPPETHSGTSCRTRSPPNIGG
jgi:hypothetical protein